MDFDDALAYLQGRLRLGVKLGNERFLALLDRLGRPQDALRVIHIGGTKGKGSTCVMAASILQAAGYHVGTYLSPYVYDVRERVQIDGEMISHADFAHWITMIRPHIEALEETDLGPTTEFELKTALGLCYFAQKNVDYAVLEVGLGGRLDATNVVPHPLVTTITNIGLDHTEILGDTLSAIAGEKAGIIKPGVPCVTGVPVGGEAWDVIASVCAVRDSRLIPITPPYPGEGLTLTTERRRLTDVPLRLHGAFQELNAAAALATLDAIDSAALPPIADSVVRQGLQVAWAPGRLEQISARPTIVVDVAHNALSATALAEALRSQFEAEKRRLILIVGLSRQHEPLPFLTQLASLRPAQIIATQPDCRPRPAEDISLAARSLSLANITVISSSVADAVRAALAQASEDDLICLTGSFYTVGDVPPSLWKELLTEYHADPSAHPERTTPS